MAIINSIDKLVSALDKATKKQIPSIMQTISLDVNALEPYATWSKDGYTRNCLRRTAAYELILICWDVQAATPIHDHGGQACWVLQLVGELTEIRFEKSETDALIETNRFVLQPCSLTYMEDTMGFHQLCNIQPLRGYTLHLYACPIDECAVYNEEKHCFEKKEMSYDTAMELTIEPD